MLDVQPEPLPAGPQRLKLLALHGFTLNAAVMEAQLGTLALGLSQHVEIVYPDSPHECSEASVERFYARYRMTRMPPPHRTWWHASDDGSVYGGWDVTRDLFSQLLVRHAPAGLLGFSQGAMLAGALCALSSQGELPSLAFAVLIGGGMPRAQALQPAFAQPIAIPSLHVWGERDALSAASAPLLAQRFANGCRQIEVWPGGHSIPTSGPAAQAIVDFVGKHAGPRDRPAAG